MDLSNLKLLIEKGHREGETLEFNSKPGFTVRIGRVVRGNTIAIKDVGVSSKHLSIDWCSEEGKWAVKDLDSSNGTFLNSSALPPHTVHDLRDGDELKIGEVTIIRVRISHVSDSQPVGRSLRSRARVLGAENLDDGKKVAEEGNRRGRGRGRGRGKGGEGLGMEVMDSVPSVAPEVNKEGNVPKEENGKGRGRGRVRPRGKGNAAIGDGGLRSEVSASIASANSEVDVESNVREVGVPRGIKSREKKDANVEDELELNPEISENVECVTQKGKSVSSRRTRSSKNDKAGGVECKVEPPSSLRRSTRSRGTKRKDDLAFTSALEKIPEASQLVSSLNCDGLENISPTEKLNAQTRRGRKKNEVEMRLQLQMDSAQSVAEEDERSEEDHNEAEQVSRESVHSVFEEGKQLASRLISGQENCNESEFVMVKPEPQSNIGGIVGKGESVSEIVQTEGELACVLNFEHETIEEELEVTLNQDDERESECNVGATVSQASTADASETEAEVEVEMGLQMVSTQSVVVEDKRSEGERNEGEQVSRESMLTVFEEGERLASGLISGQENCNDLEFVLVKPEPQSNIGGIVGKGVSVSEIVQTEGELACVLNFEHETVVEQLEVTFNQDDKRESECNVGAIVSQASTADASEKEAEAEVQMGLQMDCKSVAVEDKRSEGENNEEEQVSRESMHTVFEAGERLASGLISEQENCNELEFVGVKPEPQSIIGEIDGKGDSMSEIVQKDGDLVCELNFENDTLEEELEATLNLDDKRESECNVGATVSHESTSDASENEAEAEIAADLNKMTLGEWFDHLERSLPKQIRAETDQIIQDMLKRSQQLHEFMLQQQKDKGTLPLRL